MKDKNLAYFVFAAIIVVVLDQLTKHFVLKYLLVGASVPLLGNFLALSHITNTGAGFGIFKGFNSALSFFSLFVIGLIIYYYDNIPKERMPNLFFGIILGGAIGNLIDRIRFGAVADFIDFGFFPAFNVADMALTAGVAGLMIYYWKK